jgi:hypothetical protein
MTRLMKLQRHLATGFLFIACAAGCGPGVVTDKSGSTRRNGLPYEGTLVFDGRTHFLSHHMKTFEAAGFLAEIEAYDDALVGLYLAALKDGTDDAQRAAVRETKNVLRRTLERLHYPAERMTGERAKIETTAGLLRVLMHELGGKIDKIESLDFNAFMSIVSDDSF